MSHKCFQTNWYINNYVKTLILSFHSDSSVTLPICLSSIQIHLSLFLFVYLPFRFICHSSYLFIFYLDSSVTLPICLSSIQIPPVTLPIFCIFHSDSSVTLPICVSFHSNSSFSLLFFSFHLDSSFSLSSVFLIFYLFDVMGWVRSWVVFLLSPFLVPSRPNW